MALLLLVHPSLLGPSDEPISYEFRYRTEAGDRYESNGSFTPRDVRRLPPQDEDQDPGA